MLLKGMIAAAILLAAGPAGAADLADLEWLAGAWATETKGDAVRWTEERWSPRRAGTMLGTGLSGRGDKALSYEFMRIAVDDKGEIAFWGSPQGAAPVPFRLESATDREAVFVSPTHDYPQRIVYRRTGRGMTATTSLADGSNAQTWKYKRIRD
ncbi:MAG TPA: DUF6265 family protein [Allosphingosinicella sp.]